MVERKENLKNLIQELDENVRIIVEPLVEDIVFMEKNLDELKKYPFIRTHPRDPTLQKVTAAAKQYKELLQQYTNCLKLICSFAKNEKTGEDSPLREYYKKKMEQLEQYEQK